jgi:hypothetical protein
MQQHRSPNSDLVQRRRLMTCAGVIAAVWLVVLPYISQQAGVRTYIERNETLGIDPSAKFYTELPAMPALLDRAESVRRRNRDAFWHLGGD